jgi:energy-converting hydrogenase Eha subunit B
MIWRLGHAPAAALLTIALLTAIVAIGLTKERSPSEIAAGIVLGAVLVATSAVAAKVRAWWCVPILGFGEGAGFVALMMQWQNWDARDDVFAGLTFGGAMTVLKAWQHLNRPSA